MIFSTHALAFSTIGLIQNSSIERPFSHFAMEVRMIWLRTESLFIVVASLYREIASENLYSRRAFSAFSMSESNLPCCAKIRLPENAKKRNNKIDLFINGSK
jgi:hypothetical protein